MAKYLLMYCWGPLQSWGGIAVGESRGSQFAPTKSAVIGMISAALGMRRQRANEAVFRGLSSSIQLGIRVDSRGTRLVDYHTSQVPELRRGDTPRSRRDELITLPKDGATLHTILSTRDYSQDAAYLLALGSRNQELCCEALDRCGRPIFEPGGKVDLSTLSQALAEPSFALSLGRKSCTFGLPLAPQIVEAANMRQAVDEFDLARYRDFLTPPAELQRPVLPKVGSQVDFLWEGDPSICTISKEFIRRDEIENRERWQFQTRREFLGTVAVQS